MKVKPTYSIIKTDPSISFFAMFLETFNTTICRLFPLKQEQLFKKGMCYEFTVGCEFRKATKNSQPTGNLTFNLKMTWWQIPHLDWTKQEEALPWNI